MELSSKVREADYPVKELLMRPGMSVNEGCLYLAA
jgi:hypothetical protein